jgi:hypothetical protein
MSCIKLTLFLVLLGCSMTTGADEERKLFEKLGITNPQSRNFVRGMAALRASCTQSDSTSIQTCQTYTEQTRSLIDIERFLTNALYNPDTLTGTGRSTFNNIIILGAAYREYIEAKQTQAANERFWNSAAAGAAFGALFSRPSSQTNC